MELAAGRDVVGRCAGYHGARGTLPRLVFGLPDLAASAAPDVVGVDLSRFCDYPDCWRAGAADAVVAGVREAARGRATSG